MGKLRRFNGGIHLPENKAQSLTRPVARLPLPGRLVLPLQQHIGDEAQPLVAVGERVLKGQLIARADGYVSATLHAPTSGTVVEIGDHELPHPSRLPGLCIVIESDGREEWAERARHDNWADLPAERIHEIVREAGIVGLGGAGFPTFIKLNQGKPVETLIINAAECEPFITCDDRLMRDHPHEVIEGVRILRHAIGATQVLIGIEDNKPQAHDALVEALGDLGEAHRIEVVAVPTLYPTGGEKQLIKVLTGKEVPSQGIPLEIGVVCQNVATAFAVQRAVVAGEPLIERLVTVTGEGVAEPRNVITPFGAPMGELIRFCGGYTGAQARLVLGGPMMGLTLPHDDLPVTKTANCLLAASEAEMPAPLPAQQCIRCGRCAEACPASLLPQQLYWHARARDFDKVQDYNLFDCIECGCCAYVCPSHIPLVQYYRFAKTGIWGQERDKRKAEQAKGRHEARLARIEREKAEKAARAAKAKAALKKEAPEGDAGAEDPKKAAIQAALERVKAKKAAAGAAPKNTDNLTPDQQRQIEAAEARRKAAAAGTDEARDE